MATAVRSCLFSALGDEAVVLRNVGWRGYRDLLRMRGEKSRPRIIYLDGDALLMSPGYLHERLAVRLGQFVTEVVVGLGIPHIPAGHTTLWRKPRRCGVEADQSYYLANAARIRGNTEIRLRRDPPPDLVVEAVATHDADEAIESYRRLGAPEVWVGDEDGLRFLVLGPDRHYAESPTSRSFPFLTSAEVTDWVDRPLMVSETDWIVELRAWVRDVLVPRVQADAAGPDAGPNP